MSKKSTSNSSSAPSAARWSRVRPTRVLRGFLRDKGGAIAVLGAVLFPVVVGALGLGVETGYWYLTERKLQHAADLAAHAGGARNRAGDSDTGVRTAALNIASASGFLPTLGTMTVNRPPTSGANAGNTDAVEVILSETRARWFSSVFANGPVVIRARAVARISGGAQACILALSPTAAGALTVAGSTQVGLVGCDVASNSVSATSFLMNGSSAVMSTGCAYAVGQASVTSGLTLTTCPAVRVNAPVMRDPYRKVPAPTAFGSCQNRNVGNPVNATTLTPTDNHPSGVKSMRFCSGLDIKGRVTFMPGLYIIEGGTVSFNGGDPNATSTAEFNGTGVTFYMSNTARLALNGNVKLSLAAPTTGPYSGILFFGARNATGVNHVINGTPGTTLQGAIYAPASAVEIKGNSTTTNGCTQIIGNTVTLTGNSTLRSTCDNAGTKTIFANENIRITE